MPGCKVDVWLLRVFSGRMVVYSDRVGGESEASRTPEVRFGEARLGNTGGMVISPKAVSGQSRGRGGLWELWTSGRPSDTRPGPEPNGTAPDGGDLEAKHEPC